jgi:phage tail sheath protein FI
MAFQVSPGVEVKEIDLTNVIPAVSTSIGGYAGRFRWGPIEDISLIGSENELANKFGKPNATYARSFFEGASFLQYGNALRVVRAEETSVMNASSGSKATSLKSLEIDNDGSPSVGINGISDGDNILDNFVVTSSDATDTVPTLENPLYVIDTVALSSTNSPPNTSGYVAEDVSSFTIAGKAISVEVDTVSGGDPASVSITTLSAGKKFTVSELKGLTAANMLTIPTTNVSGIGAGMVLDITFKLSSVTISDGGLGLNGSTLTFKANKQDSSSTLVTVTSAFTATLATAGDSDLQIIKNDDAFDNVKSGLNDDAYSRYAGALGNKTRVYILNSVNFGGSFTGADGNSFAAASNFDAAPDATNEVHILVTTTAKEFTGDNSEATELVVENWPFLGVSSTAKAADGSNNYYSDVINARSEWVYVPSAITSIATLSATNGTLGLSGGLDGAATRNDGMVTTALDLLADAETVDVSLLFAESDNDGVGTLGNKVLDIAKVRKDCVGFVSPPVADTKGIAGGTAKDNVIDYRNNTLTSGTDSYGVIGSTSLYIYDKYNDAFIHIGSQGHLAGLCANTDGVAAPWFSPAGFNRGSLRSVAKVDFNPSKIQRDDLYKAGINPITAFPGQGIVLFGDKTLQAKPSAFDRINVRRLFIVLEKAIATAAKFQLFELNDEFTRATFRNAVEPFLRDVQGRRGITDFLVICDDTNNTGQVIDTNRFVADIFIKPARSINFITLSFIATRTGVDFAEVVGLSNG